jgi:hypothetical protein
VRARAINADAVTLIRVEEVGFEVLPLRPLRAPRVEVPLREDRELVSPIENVHGGAFAYITLSAE